MPIQKKAMVFTAFCLRLPVIALSIVREIFTARLNQQDSDPSYGGALVVILMEIELAYAIAANTLSVLKAFTESFNSGFGQGFTRGKGSQYDMSGLSKETGQSSESSGVAKRKSGSILKGLTSTEQAEVLNQDLSSPDRGQSPNSFMKLRPEHEGENITRVSTDPGRAWRMGHHTANSDSSGDDMVIRRETELSIYHDRAPILATPGRQTPV